MIELTSCIPNITSATLLLFQAVFNINSDKETEEDAIMKLK